MPGSLLSVDNAFPRFSGRESAEEKINTILNYLYQLREQLRWTLGNLDAENFNDTGLSEIGETFSEPIYERIADVEGDVSELSLTADGLFTRITSAEGDISTLSLTASSLTTRITSAEGDISTLSQTASGLSARVTTAEGQITSLSLTVNGLSLSAASGDTYSLISLQSGSITLSTAVVSITGMVTFSSLSGDGTSVINGANIMTGTISSSKLAKNPYNNYIEFGDNLFLVYPANSIAGLDALYFNDLMYIYESGGMLTLYSYGGINIVGDGLYVNGTKII